MAHADGGVSVHIKQDPSDFRVEERIAVDLGDQGDYALYRLEKRGWTTPDAIAAIRRRWRIDAWRVAVGGLKDRHAHTIQYLTILRGPERKFTQQNIALTYVGRIREPLRSDQIVANRFEITLRDAGPDQVAHALAALEAVRRFGVPNYFDDQRFGSVQGGGPFMARLLVLGDTEAALKVALTSPYAFDRAAAKREKAVLRQRWGDWKALGDRLPRGHIRSIVDHLQQHPADFGGAVAKLRPELRGLYLSAYQSHMWNRMLAAWLEAQISADQLIAVRLRTGVVPMHRSLTAEQQPLFANLELPLHSPRVTLEADDPRKRFFDAVLAAEGVTQEQMKLKGVRGLFFSKGERRAFVMPAELTAEAADDESHAGRQKLTLRFELPRGAYATLIVKRISV